MRLFLDAHVSGRNIGDRLAGLGHDVRALDREPHLEGLADEEVLALATADGCILVTFDVADFPAILREWGVAGRTHAGVILIHGIDHSEFGPVVRGIERWLAAYPEQQQWRDRAVVLSRAFASGTTG